MVEMHRLYLEFGSSFTLSNERQIAKSLIEGGLVPRCRHPNCDARLSLLIRSRHLAEALSEWRVIRQERPDR
jgi:hypothetical protein